MAGFARPPALGSCKLAAKGMSASLRREFRIQRTIGRSEHHLSPPLGEVALLSTPIAVDTFGRLECCLIIRHCEFLWYRDLVCVA